MQNYLLELIMKLLNKQTLGKAHIDLAEFCFIVPILIIQESYLVPRNTINHH